MRWSLSRGNVSNPREEDSEGHSGTENLGVVNRLVEHIQAVELRPARIEILQILSNGLADNHTQDPSQKIRQALELDHREVKRRKKRQHLDVQSLRVCACVRARDLRHPLGKARKVGKCK